MSFPLPPLPTPKRLLPGPLVEGSGEEGSWDGRAERRPWNDQEKKGEEEREKPRRKATKPRTYQGKKRQSVLWLYAGRVWMQCLDLERLL